MSVCVWRERERERERERVSVVQGEQEGAIISSFAIFIDHFGHNRS